MGEVFSFMVKHAKGGDNKRYNYICNEINEDIIIFGSSRAFHHYNPAIITDSLGMSCYNCGQEGNGIVLNYGRYQLISQRYHPKLLIYDVIPSYDLLSAEDNQKYLGHLRPYYDKEVILELFDRVDKTSRVKMMSKLYRYNSKFVQIVSDFIHPQRVDDIKGFRPIHQEMDTLKINKKKFDGVKPCYDTLKIQLLKDMIEESKTTKVVFVVSPYWNEMDTTVLAPLKTICANYSIPILDFSNDKRFLHQNCFFFDSGHLNSRGADYFTRELIKELKMYDLY